jgi:hypothetical protein
LALPDDDIAQLEARTEGWIAGLKLAALSLQSSPGVDSETFVNGFGGSHHYISDYLIEEVLDGLPDELRDFLLQTSITTCLQSSLCDALTGQRPMPVKAKSATTPGAPMTWNALAFSSRGSIAQLSNMTSAPWKTRLSCWPCAMSSTRPALRGASWAWAF